MVIVTRVGNAWVSDSHESRWSSQLGWVTRTAMSTGKLETVTEVRVRVGVRTSAKGWEWS